MPAIYTHTLIADKVFNRLGSPKYIKDHFSEYMLGSIGLDFFAYQNALHPIKSSKIDHIADICRYQKHHDLLIYMLSATAKEVDLMMYYLGYLTNHCANRAIHPFVLSSTERPEGGSDISSQHILEQAIDTFYHKKLNLAGMPIQSKVFDKIDKMSIAKISQMLSYSINKTMESKEVSRSIIERTYDDASAFTHKSQPTYGVLVKKQQVRQLSPPSFLPGNDIMNLSHRQWRSLENPAVTTNHSITDLFDMAVDSSVELISVVNGFFIGESEIDDVKAAITAYI